LVPAARLELAIPKALRSKRSAYAFRHAGIL
jgi:hypothetical protein